MVELGGKSSVILSKTTTEKLYGEQRKDVRFSY